MSLYRQVGSRRGGVAAAAAAALVVGIVAGLLIGRATSDTPSLGTQLRAVQADARRARDALELVSIEYPQADAPTEYQAALAGVDRAREALAEAQEGLELLQPGSASTVGRSVDRIAALVRDRAPAAEVAAEVKRADQALVDAARLR